MEMWVVPIWLVLQAEGEEEARGIAQAEVDEIFERIADSEPRTAEEPGLVSASVGRPRRAQ